MAELPSDSDPEEEAGQAGSASWGSLGRRQGNSGKKEVKRRSKEWRQRKELEVNRKAGEGKCMRQSKDSSTQTRVVTDF